MAEYPQPKLLIDGEWRSRPGEPVINPADGSMLAEVPHATRDDLDDALAAAERGLDVWRRYSPGKRSDILRRAAVLLRERADSIAVAMTLEQGKPVAQAKAEVLGASNIIDWDAEEGRRTYGRIVPAEAGMRNTVMRQPIGVVAGFSPWNFPVASPNRKLAGALAAGCAIILKASEETPAGAMMLVQAFVDAGVPKGVVSLVYGVPGEISAYLIPHPLIRLVTFTGSVPVGKKLTALAGDCMKPSIMELGGHAPVIVARDTDPVVAAKISLLGKSRNAGQVCTSPTRFFVEEEIFDSFVTQFVESAKHLKIGNGLDATTDLGPLANPRRVEAMERIIADATARGARLLAGGERRSNQGNFFPMTVLADVPDDAEAMRQEPFGPLALINRVDKVATAIRKANSVPYGLAGYAFTNATETIEQLSDGLEVGNLSINHVTASFPEIPFGGVKESGIGREGGSEGLQGYMTVKSVSHRLALGG